MKRRTPHEREVSELVIAANSGEADEKQLARLDELIRADSQLANHAAQLLDQLAALAWQGSMHGDLPEKSACETLADQLAADRPQSTRTSGRHSTAARQRWMWLTIAAGIGFVIGGLTAATISRNATMSASAPTSALAAGSPAISPATYEARLIRSTACLWEGSTASSPEIGGDLTSGESLHLLEGVAEFTLNWLGKGRASLSLEGPAAMMLTTDGMPTLRFGRLSATINTALHPFILETSVGRLTLAEYGSIGVSAFGNEGEIHIFSGSATFEAAWRSPEQTTPLKIEAGQSIRIQTGENGEPQITWHAADPEYFAAQLSMSSDSLVIPPAYVSAIKKSLPIGYWRFERDDWPNVPNMMGPQLACHVDGSLGRTVYQGNQAVEFGVTNQGGDVISSEVIGDSIHDSYSVEFWVKPSHYHMGAVVALVGDTPMESGVLPHGMLVELGGTGKVPSAVHHPGCIRFLHRSPASNVAGTSCFSETAYTLRKWQHVAATKDGAKMRLYINGELVAEGQDASELPTGLRLLVGKLYPTGKDRPFIGQFDELALYNRALGPEEVSAHYHLVRPKKTSGPSI